MIFNNCTQYLLSLIIIISTWEPVMPLYLSLEQKPRSMGRESVVSASPLGLARSQWSRRHLGSEQGRLLEAFYAFWTWGAFPVLLQRSCSPGVPVPGPAQPPALPLAAQVAFRIFVCFVHGDPEQTLAPQCPDLCELHGTESVSIIRTLVNLWSSSVLAMFRFTCLCGFFSPLKK